ncbi:esterase [Robbsia sp. Bb-Pol-6]|uniref:Esterase n=1 Tax=Robbsia betulipollinis TaxID=2981849 RepID=A0ABT3ZI86_9BURK|nr:esterase [Robbsia betulipollinis]MCY0386172.1 esterase [Robbsia betulipollinis]
MKAFGCSFTRTVARAGCAALTLALGACVVFPYSIPATSLDNAAARQASADALTGPVAILRQGSFFLGGHDVHSDTLSTSPKYEASGTVTVDQMYVHYQTPVNAKPVPITLVHGCCLTGTSWETTPDGRMGWDDYFVRRGYSTYVIDQSERGRSAAKIGAINGVKLGSAPPARLPDVFAASHEAAWKIFRFGPAYPQAWPGEQFPVEAQGELWKQMVPDWSGSLPTPNPTVPALSQLAIKLGHTVLVSHSQAGIYPFQTAALSTRGVAGIVALEPAECPSASADLTPYAKMPILVVFGDYIDQSPRWAPRLKACRGFVDATNRAGGQAKLLVLPDIGIHGNTHMMMQDRNNLEVADQVLQWIDTQVERAAQ